MGFSRNGLPFSSPEDLSDPGMEPTSPALADGFFTTELPGKPQFNYSSILKNKFKKLVLKEKSDIWKGLEGKWGQGIVREDVKVESKHS